MDYIVIIWHNQYRAIGIADKFIMRDVHQSPGFANMEIDLRKKRDLSGSQSLWSVELGASLVSARAMRERP